MMLVIQFFKRFAWASALFLAATLAHAQDFNSGFVDNQLEQTSGDAALQSRIERLEITLAETQQMLQAQRVLATREQMRQAMELRNRLEALESKLSGVNPSQPINGSVDGDIAANLAQNDAIARSRLNELEDATRLMRGQIDSLLLQFDALMQDQSRARDDSEFRFQQIESSLRKLQNNGVSTASEPQVLGRIKRLEPVVPIDIGQGGENALIGEAGTAAVDDGGNAAAGANQPSNGPAPEIALIAPLTANDKLVGEGEMPTLGNAPTARPVLQDPKQLYDRALADLRKGLYLQAEADFTQILSDFPAHSLAGNAQYWLGETYYVRQDFKRAAEAFLAGYTTYAKSNKAPDSLLKLGITLVAMGEQKTGCDAFAELAAKFPEATQAIVKRAEIEKRRAGCQG